MGLLDKEGQLSFGDYEEKFVLTRENYFSKEADERYMSVSQYKDFVGSYGRTSCEARAMARFNRIWAEAPSKAMLIGSYVDAYFEGTLPQFKDSHPEIFKKDGTLYADYAQADQMIERVKKDQLFMKYMSGEKQVVMTGEIGGVPWKIRMDSYIPHRGIVDLKVMESLSKTFFIRDIGEYLDFVRYWGYDIQGAVYQEIVRQNTGETLPFYIAGISKEKDTDYNIIHVDNAYLKEALKLVEWRLPQVLDIKNGGEEPHRCEVCNYCRSTKVLRAPIGLSDLVFAV